MTRMSSLRNLVTLAVFLSASFGCGGSPIVQVQKSSIQSSASKILAVDTVSGTNNIGVYDLPITATSTPVATIPESSVWGLTFDNAGRLFVDVGGQIQVFDQPISTGAKPAFVINAPSGHELLFQGGLAFDSSGDLFVGGGRTPNGCHWYCTHPASVSVLDAPISGSSAIAFTFVESNGLIDVVSNAAFDRSGNLWAVLDNGGPLDETAPPFNGNSQTQTVLSPPYTIPEGVAFDSAGNMYVSTGVATGSGVEGDIIEYDPPFTGSSQPTLLFSNTTFDDGYGIALDTSGNMYAGTTSGLFMFSPPFTATGAPVVTLPGSFGHLAVGP